MGPTGSDAWERLQGANGRTALPGHERLGPGWAWHCPPLAEWDGVTIPRRTFPPPR